MHTHSPFPEADMTDLPQILLVPVDGSQNANAAAEYAARLAEKLGLRVRLLYAFPETPMDLFGWPKEGDRVEDLKYFTAESFEKLRGDTSKAVFDAARKAMGDISATVEEQVISGEPGKAILEHTGAIEGGMIVMGRRGLSRLKELVMGSTTQRVLHHSKCPVLVIH
jgi:nucleotide-binding universal stress UspA family protein